MYGYLDLIQDIIWRCHYDIQPTHSQRFLLYLLKLDWSLPIPHDAKAAALRRLWSHLLGMRDISSSV